MARIRSIKPEFFLHEELAELSPIHRLLFIGLWTLADREGRLEDRPRRIQVSLLPYDKGVDVEAVLADLAAAGFILRYVVAGQAIIAIPSFGEHQFPHHKEPPSTLPGTDGSVSDQTPYPDEKLRQIVYERDGYRCGYCGVDMSEQSRMRCLDHVVPMAQGGRHTEDNLVTACKRCNARKGGRTPEQAGMPWSKGVNPPVDPPLTPRQPSAAPLTHGNMVMGTVHGNGTMVRGAEEERRGAVAPPSSAEPVGDLSPELAEAVLLCRQHEFLGRMLDPALVLRRVREAHPELDLVRTVRRAIARLTPERVIEQQRQRRGPDGFLVHFFANADRDRIADPKAPDPGGDDMHDRVKRRLDEAERIEREALEREQREDEAARRVAPGGGR